MFPSLQKGTFSKMDASFRTTLYNLRIPVIMKDSPATKIFHAKVRNTELALQLFMVQTAFCHLPKTWI